MDEGGVEESHRKKTSFIQIRWRVRSGIHLGKANAGGRWLKTNTTG